MINAAANEENLQKLLAIKLGLPESQASDPREVAKFIESTPGGPNIYTRAKSLMTTTPTVMAAAKGGDTETTATTTPVEPDDVPTKTPEEMAEEIQRGQQESVYKAFTDPSNLMKTPEVATIDPASAGTIVDPTTGQITTATPQVDPSAIAAATTAATPDTVTSETVDAKTAAPEVTTALAGVDPVTGVVSDAAKVTAATKDPATTGIKDLTAAQGEAVVMTNPVQREIQEGELVSGAADATKAAAFTEQVQAATATPSEQATVQGQLSTLMTQFEGGNTPAWAAGAMRAATAAMAARGLGASSMAGQAVVQAAMESALPVAMADAQTQSTFEAQNLSNRQQRAMLAAQQRATFMGQEFDQAFQARVSNAAKISDVANMNFTAEQQIALENSRNANTINLANLTNRQALVLAEASAFIPT